jgi:small ligand-binding sensory domain FIST
MTCLLRDLGLAQLDDPRAALPRLRSTLVGLTDAHDTALAISGMKGGQFGTDTRVRHLVGLDPSRLAVAVADTLEPGMRLAFCQRDVQAARRDLVRICSEIRDEVETQAEAATAAAGLAAAAASASATADEPRRRIQGAIYISCSGRGGPHFGGPSAELQIVQHALGAVGDDIPLVGFFAAGEIARHHVYGYTGVLTVFTDAAGPGA